MKNPDPTRERGAYRRPHETITFERFPSGEPRFVTAGFKSLDNALDATRDLEERSYDRDRISVFMATDEGDQVAWWAHIGGFLCGLILTFVLRSRLLVRTQS